MQTKNIIQASAKVIRITDLVVGNVVKYVEEGYSNPEVKYAIVSEIMNDGEKTFIELISFKRDYSSGAKLEKKLLAGDKDISIFPASKNDLISDYNEMKEGINRDIEEKEKEISKMKSNFAWLEDKIETHEAQELTEPKFEILENK